MSRVLAIARNTLRELARERVVLVLALFGLALVLGSQALSPLALGEGRKVVIDFGLAASMLLATLLAVFLGSSLLHKELERRTIYAVLSKPIRREEFLLGKFVGLWVTTGLLLAGMTLILLAVVTLSYRETPWSILGAAALSLVELGIVTALVILFSAFTTPLLASLFSCGLFLAGHLSRDLRALGAQSDQALVRDTSAALYRVLPDLQGFDLGIQAVHGLPIAASDVWLPLVYGAGYTGLLLLGAVAIFERRDFR